jgi:hypothetical protein
METQISFLQNIWPDLPPHLQVHFNTVLSKLNTKIEAATTLADGAIGQRNHEMLTANIFGKIGKLHRGRLTFSVQDCLDKTIEDIKSWQQDMLDPSWFQLLRVSNPNIDNFIIRQTAVQPDSLTYLQDLRACVRQAVKGAVANEASDGSMFIPEIALKSDRDAIQYSTAQTVVEDASGSYIIVDNVPCIAVADQKETSDDVHHLAKLLSKIDPRVFCLLNCTGVIKHLNRNGTISSFDFIFARPSNLRNPRSLRQVLLENNQRVSLNKRLEVAQQLAKAVMFIHSVKLVHKNIRPEVVLSFPGPQTDFEQAFLVGFEKFRPIGANSTRSGDSLWERNLYRHPSRQGVRPEQDFTMQHDIYSLGVCLLEIGLWCSFLSWTPNAKSPELGKELNIAENLKNLSPLKKANKIKEIFITMAHDMLPGKMGQRYATITLACLKCLDRGNTGFGDVEDLEDEEGILVGVCYMEKVGLSCSEIMSAY